MKYQPTGRFSVRLFPLSSAKLLPKRFSFIVSSVIASSTPEDKSSENDNALSWKNSTEKFGTRTDSSPSTSRKMVPSLSQSSVCFPASFLYFDSSHAYSARDNLEHVTHTECPRLPEFEFEISRCKEEKPLKIDLIGPLSCLSDRPWFEDIPFLELGSDTPDIGLVNVQDFTDRESENPCSEATEPVRLAPRSVADLSTSSVESRRNSPSNILRGPGSDLYETLSFHAELCKRLEDLLDDCNSATHSQASFKFTEIL
ncbi:hypothetical protein CROQUDRAFT_189555 [Cronartium quercuum f. sp. fusiforme G11]|uniref:Uncharacterized protein n=1 Tax=Cronartium quercuum f. sp. fusiforme G11 TaxID=708437 RepID=A0A9P6NCX5_9BASI|nr:hypothetical protein CROQUDRAFT_189555 [Cronartium quercuum f. sp. fusiforme G11]